MVGKLPTFGRSGNDEHSIGDNGKTEEDGMDENAANTYDKGIFRF